jgi:hypothetical protein
MNGAKLRRTETISQVTNTLPNRSITLPSYRAQDGEGRHERH